MMHNAVDKTALWDQMAGNYQGYTEQTAENNPVIRFLEAHDFITPRSRVLDLGCGSGKYTFYFARRCKEVVGLDISSGMLQNAEAAKAELSCRNVHFCCEDWETIPDERLKELGGFDLVFANMTPAVASEKAFQKMLSVSRGWCYYCGPVKRTRRVNDGVYQIFGLPLHTQKNEQRIPDMFRYIWNSGYLPELSYVESHACWEMPAEQAYAHYLNLAQAMLQMRGIDTVSSEQREKLRCHLSSLQENGIVREQLDGVNAILIWNTQKKGGNKCIDIMRRTGKNSKRTWMDSCI